MSPPYDRAGAATGNGGAATDGLSRVVATQESVLLDSLIRSAQRIGAWEDLLPVNAAMSTESLQRLAATALPQPELVERLRALGRADVVALLTSATVIEPDGATTAPAHRRPRPGPGAPTQPSRR